MAKKSFNMIVKMMDPNIIDYYIINCAIPSIITIENRYKIDFGKPAKACNNCTKLLYKKPSCASGHHKLNGILLHISKGSKPHT